MQLHSSTRERIPGSLSVAFSMIGVYYPQESQRDWLITTTPGPFKRRNIFVGGSVLDNKYELQQMFGSKPKWTVWSGQELQKLLASGEVN